MSMHMSAGGAAPTVFMMLSIMFIAAAWVYSDAKTQADQGNPIDVSVGSLRLNTPVAWFLACLVLAELFIPLYVESRGLA
jgi:hypothetical protein